MDNPHDIIAEVLVFVYALDALLVAPAMLGAISREVPVLSLYLLFPMMLLYAFLAGAYGDRSSTIGT